MMQEAKKRLPQFRNAASRNFMRGLVISFILLVALFAGSLHAPSAAHAMDDSPHAAHDGDAHEMVLDYEHGAPQSAGDGGSAAHHHHCPPAVTNEKIELGDGPLPATQMKFPQPANALASLSRAPPIKPPPA